MCLKRLQVQLLFVLAFVKLSTANDISDGVLAFELLAAVDLIFLVCPKWTLKATIMIVKKPKQIFPSIQISPAFEKEEEN